MPYDSQPPQLSGEYCKARRQLMLWSALLFAWQLVGFEVADLANSGGNVGAVAKAIKNPELLPWILVILIGYFLFRTCVEWYHCSSERREMRVSLIDFSSGWVVAFSALLLYFGQKIADVRIAEFAGATAGFTGFVFGAATASVFSVLIRHLVSIRSLRSRDAQPKVKTSLVSIVGESKFLYVTGVSLAILFTYASIWSGGDYHLFLVGMAVALLVSLFWLLAGYVAKRINMIKIGNRKPEAGAH